MTSKINRPDDAEQLRKRAEELVRKRAEESPETGDAFSFEEYQRMLHELSVHQIELEMQNEELHRRAEELDSLRLRYFDLYNLAPVGYCTISEEGQILEANETAAALLGLSGGELDKQPITRFIFPADQDIFYLHRKELFETREPQVCEMRVIKSDGTVLWVNFDARFSQDDSGISPVCRTAMSDITDRKMQQDVRDLASRLILLVNTPGDFLEFLRELTASLLEWSMCEAVGIRLRDGSDYPYFVTKGFPREFVQKENRLCAYDADGETMLDSEGNPVLECLCGVVLNNHLSPARPYFTEKGSFWSNNTATLLEAIAAQAHSEIQMHNQCLREGYESLALIPLSVGRQVFGLLQFCDHRPNRFTAGMIAHFETMADNIAIALSRRQAEEALIKSEELLAKAQDIAHIGSWDLDVTSNRLTCSGEVFHILGVSRKSFTGTYEAFRKFVHPEDREAVDTAYSSSLPFGTNDYEVWYRILRKDSSDIRYIYEKCLHIRDAAGSVLRSVGIIQDITEQKLANEERENLQEQLKQSQKMESVGRLAGGVAHDFNNMLGVILGHAEIALDQVKPSHPIHLDLIEIKKAAERSALLTRQLLAFARKQVIQPRVINLNETITGMLKMLRRMIGENISLDWKPAKDLWPVRMDPSQVDQLLANLCVNARDAIKDTGRILIGTKTAIIDDAFCASHKEFIPGEFVVLTFSDDGCGMEREIIEKIFEPFYTTKAVGTGTGLGLATVYGAVKQNNGFITVYSEPEHGTIFKIFLPRHVEELEDAHAEIEEEADRKGSESILLVEDEPAVLKLTTSMLETLGYKVRAAGSGDEAMKLAGKKTEEIHLLITDVIMPGMNGRELAERLRAVFPEMKCLFISGYTADFIAQRGVLGEGTCFIQKPFSKKNLSFKVREALDS